MQTKQPRLDVPTHLMSAHVKLGRAHDESTVLRAVADAVAPLGPDNIYLAYLHLDARGEPAEVEVVRTWEDGRELAEHSTYGVRFPATGDGVAARLLRSATEPLLIADIFADPVIGAAMRATGRTTRSCAVLPLYSERHGAWQGVLGLFWREPQDFSDAGEVELYRMLMRMVAEAIAGERTLRALRESLAANERLLTEARDALRDSQTRKTTLQVLLDNLPLGVAVLRAATGERELINRTGEGMLGHHAEDGRVDTSLPYVFAPGSSEPLAPERMPHARTMATGEPASAEVELERRPGERTLFKVTTALLRYPEDPEVRLIFLYQDITQARRDELARLAVQDELLRVQAVALAERSTPLIPIRDDILVMPIIGAIDVARGRQILEALVDLGGRTRVRAAIIDVTGVKQLDTTAAGTLISAARALRLRGVTPILSGIQPLVAATLVQLGVDLAGVTVCGTLQDGVSAASRGPRA